MSFDVVIALVAFAFVSSITPGPNNLMLMASGTNYGIARTVPHFLGVSIGFTIMIVMVGLGLMGLFDAFPISYQVLKYLSVSYLVFLAWKIATAAPVITDSQQPLTQGKPMTFLQAALFQWVNPKAWAMALTAVSVYTPESQPWFSVLLVAMICGLVNLPSVFTWVVLGTQLKRFLNNSHRLRAFNFTAAGLLLGSLYPILF